MTEGSETAQPSTYTERKLLALAKVKGLDNGILPILERFNRLPFQTTSSCTGHVDKHGHLTEAQFFPLSFGFDGGSLEERGMQKRFQEDLPKLNLRIANHLGSSPEGLKLRLVGQTVEHGDEWIEIPVEECIREGLSVSLELDIKDVALQQNGRNTLITFWKDFWHYLAEIDHQTQSEPDFDETFIFAKKAK